MPFIFFCISFALDTVEQRIYYYAVMQCDKVFSSNVCILKVCTTLEMTYLIKLIKLN